MMVAGVSVPDAAILDLTRRLRDAHLDDAAERLEHACDMQAKIVGLTVPEREAVLRTLADCCPTTWPNCAAYSCASTNGDGSTGCDTRPPASADLRRDGIGLRGDLYRRR